MAFQVFRLQHLKAFDGSRCSLFTSTSLKNETEWADAKPFSEVPGPKKWPILGTTWQLLPVVGTPTILTLNEFTYDLLILQTGIGISPTNQLAIHDYQAKKYGRIGRKIYPGFPPIVWTVDPDDVETVFRNEGRFPVTMGLETLKKYRKEWAEHFSAAGLMLAQGEDWWKIRSRAQQSMLKPKNIYNYLPAINEIGDEFIDR
jgi:Cytochrome P450